MALIPVAGASCLIAGGTASQGGLARFLSVKPLVSVGEVSYGWYLWHWPAIVFAGILWPNNQFVLVAAALGALAPAYLSYRLVENPIRLNQRIRGRRVLVLAAVCVLVPALASTALRTVAGRSSPAAAALGTAGAMHADVVRGCDNPTPIQARAASCTWEAADPRGTIALVGDSNAGQFTEPLAKAADGQGFNFTVATFSSCPFVDLTLHYTKPGYDSAACRRFVQQSLVGLVQLKPSLVVIASAGSKYVSHEEFSLSSPSGGIGRSPDDKARLWSAGLSSVLDDLGAAGIPSVVVHTVPQFDEFDLRNCPSLWLDRALEACGARLSRSRVEAQQKLARDSENAAIASHPLATAVDFRDDLCNATSCSTNSRSEWLYRDGAHLSIAGAMTLSGRFGDLIQARLG
jgi:hypothetical protein